MSWTHDGLCKATAQFFLTTGGCDIVCRELHSELREIPDLYCVYKNYSVVCEVKISRADFFKDRHKIFRKHPKLGLGTFRYYVCPEGMIKPEELPYHWGLIYGYDDGSIKLIRGKAMGYQRFDNAYYFQVDPINENKAMYSLLKRAASWGIGEHGSWEYNTEKKDMDDILNKENVPRIYEDEDVYTDSDFYVDLDDGDMPVDVDDSWEEIITEDECYEEEKTI